MSSHLSDHNLAIISQNCTVASVRSACLAAKLKKMNSNENDYALQILKRVSENGYMTDFTLIAAKDGQRFETHKIILAAASDLFATKFFPTSADSKNKEFTVEDVDGATLKKVIDCCYTGQIALDEKIACEVIILANNLCFSYIENKCAEYLMSTISRENCGRLLTIADRTNVQNFVTKSIEFISKEFAHIESDQLLEINSFSLFSAILESDKIEAPEEIVFNRFKQWLDDKKNERSKLVCPLMINIQLYRISGQFLLDEVEPFCDEYGCEWLLKRECNRRIADAPITMPAQRFSHTVTPRNKSIFDI